MFKYTPEDVDCRNCIESTRKGCASVHCPYVAERIEAGVVGYGEAVAETFRTVPAIRLRLAYMISTFPGTFWHDEEHKRRMDSINFFAGYNRKRRTNEYYAATYLLSADSNLYHRAINSFTRKGIAFDCIKLRSVTVQEYTLLGAAKTIYLGTKHVTLADLADYEIIGTECFRLIVNAILIAHYGVDVLQIRSIRSAYKYSFTKNELFTAEALMMISMGHTPEMRE